MDDYDLDTAFFKRLQLLTFDGKTLKSDEVYDPKDGEAHRRGTVILGKPETVGFGNGVSSRVDGFYQIDIYVPRTKAKAVSVVQKAKRAHVTHFFPANGRGLTVTEEATSAHILSLPNASSPSREGAFLRAMVEVWFHIDIPAVG